MISTGFFDARFFEDSAFFKQRNDSLIVSKKALQKQSRAKYGNQSSSKLAMARRAQ